MVRRRSLGWPITLGVVMILLLVVLIIAWVVLTVLANQNQPSRFWWALLALGSTFLGLMLVGVILYLWISVKEIRLNQRQSNFIDSVTHELKSPIASLKLYLQTLTRRPVSESQQAEFFRFMLEDLQRLDLLINHLLAAAQLDQVPEQEETIEVSLQEVLQECVTGVCQFHHVSPEVIRQEISPSVVRARRMDIEMIFRNLLDNALKYASEQPEILLESWANAHGQVITRVTDNGPGIPIKLRRKIFGRFVRLGNELERSKPGTGLGLFIVRNLVKRLQGKIHVRGRGTQRGTIFEVILPGRSGKLSDSISQGVGLEGTVH